MTNFIDNDSKSFVKTAMSLPLLEETHELDLALKWRDKKNEKVFHELIIIFVLFFSNSIYYRTCWFF